MVRSNSTSWLIENKIKTKEGNSTVQIVRYDEANDVLQKKHDLINLIYFNLFLFLFVRVCCDQLFSIDTTWRRRQRCNSITFDHTNTGVNDGGAIASRCL